jgi:hypothetical protein
MEGGFAMHDIASRPLLDGKDLDAAIDHTRATLSALLRVPGGGDGVGDPKMLEARALLGALLDHRVALAAARMDQRDAAAVAAAGRLGQLGRLLAQHRSARGRPGHRRGPHR